MLYTIIFQSIISLYREMLSISLGETIYELGSVGLGRRKYISDCVPCLFKIFAMNEMKQTAVLMLRIPRLRAIFVQMNEAIKLFNPYWLCFPICWKSHFMY